MVFLPGGRSPWRPRHAAGWPAQAAQELLVCQGESAWHVTRAPDILNDLNLIKLQSDIIHFSAKIVTVRESVQSCSEGLQHGPVPGC